MDPYPYPSDFTTNIKLRELEKRIEVLEAAIKKPCVHTWEMNARGDLPAVFFNGTNAFIRCTKCGQRKQA